MPSDRNDTDVPASVSLAEVGLALLIPGCGTLVCARDGHKVGTVGADCHSVLREPLVGVTPACDDYASHVPGLSEVHL